MTREFIFEPDTDDYEYQQNRSYWHEAWQDVPYGIYLAKLYEDQYDYAD